MSILQEYEKHSKYIGKNKLDAIERYISYVNKTKTNNTYYSDIVYKKVEWEKFEKWYKKVYNIKYGESRKRD